MAGLWMTAMAGLLALEGPARAEAGSAVPTQVWFMNYSKPMRRERMQRFGLPEYADGTSRLEPELQGTADLSRLPAIVAEMDALAASPRKAAALFGAGFSVVKVRKEPRDVWDSYRDTADGQLAATGASLRFRTENGITKVNFKPPTAQRFPDGVAYRVETGVNVLQSSDVVGFLRARRFRDNPLRELSRLYAGRDVAEFLGQAVEIRQERAIYEIHKGGNKVAEVTVDRVRARDPHDAAKPEVAFGRVELEADHITLQPTAAQAAKQAQTTWKGPHRASDTTNAALTQSPEVQQVHRLVGRLSPRLGVRPAGVSKYTEARRLLGLAQPTARQVQHQRPARVRVR